MSKINKKKLVKSSIFAFILIIPALVVAIFSGVLINNTKVPGNELNSTWYYLDAAGNEKVLSTKAKYDVDANEEFVIYTDIPFNQDDYNTLLIYTKQQRIQVYLDDELFFDNSTKESRLIGKAEQGKINLVTLPKNIEGKRLKVIITSPYEEFSGYIESIRVGYRHNFIMEIFTIHFPYLAFGFFLFISAIVLLLSTVLFVKSNEDIKRMVSLLSAEAFLSLALLCESKILTIYIDGYLNAVTYICLIVFVTLFLYYMLNSISKKTYRVILMTLYVISIIHLFVSPILHIIGIFDLFESLVITIILLMVTITVFAIYKIYQLIESKRNNKPVFECVLGCLIFLTFLGSVVLSYTDITYYVIPCLIFLIYIFYKYGSSITDVILNAKKSAEYEAQLKETKNYLIQSQMKSHFIFNTLGAIRTMIVSQPNTAYNMMTDFTKYLRANISNISPNEQIPFSQELDHIKAYVNIEKQRFQRRLEVVYDIKSTNFLIPPLSVEPLVENAVKHGVCKRVEGGTVRIATDETKDKYIIIVEDNGVGFDPNILDDESKKNSVGLKYIKIRLETLAHANFVIESVPGKGTVATISINKNK